MAGKARLHLLEQPEEASLFRVLLPREVLRRVQGS